MTVRRSAKLNQLILMLQSSRVGLTLDDIIEELDCGRRTAYSMFKDIEDLYPNTPPESSIDDDGRARWKIEGQPIDLSLSLEANELVAAEKAIEFLRAHNMEKMASSLSELKTKLGTLASARDDKERRLKEKKDGFSMSKFSSTEQDAENISSYIGFTLHPKPITVPDAKVLEKLELAIILNQRINFSYQAPGARESHVVDNHCPFGLLMGDHQYLVAFAYRRPNNMKAFRLDGISRLRVQDNLFKRPANITISEIANQSYAANLEEESHEVILQFSQKASHEARKFQFHPNQVAKEDSDKKLRLTFRTGGLKEICWELFRWQGEVEILDPPELKEEMERQLELASKTLG